MAAFLINNFCTLFALNNQKLQMKHFFILFSTLFVNLLVAQDINQFDADGKRHGIWKKNYDGTEVIRYQGQFIHGKEVGEFKYYKNIDEKPLLFATKLFNDTDDIAEVTFFSSKGNIVSKGKMKAKLFIGEWLYYHKNSEQLMRVENYDDNGLQQGELLVYFKDGTLTEKSSYKDGLMHGLSTIFNENGIKIKAFIYVNGQLNGSVKYYSNSGALEIEGQYKNDKKHGIWYYYENGILKKEKDFTVKSKNPYKKQ